MNKFYCPTGLTFGMVLFEIVASSREKFWPSFNVVNFFDLIVPIVSFASVYSVFILESDCLPGCAWEPPHFFYSPTIFHLP